MDVDIGYLFIFTDFIPNICIVSIMDNEII